MATKEAEWYEWADRMYEAAGEWARHPCRDIYFQMKSGFVLGAQGKPVDTRNYSESDLAIYRTAYAAGERWAKENPAP